MEELQPEATRLRKNVEWALRRAIDPTDVLPMLHRLARTAAPGSEESLFAHRQLAELIAPRHPWRAALYARRVLAQRSDDDRAWAVLALCQTLLGNYRCAVSAYHRALTCSNSNPWYAHNLGHLLDVALGRAEEALFWLKRAYGHSAGNPEIAASYAHALARAGRLPEAKKVIAKALKRGTSRELTALARWLDQGAPAGKDFPPPHASSSCPHGASEPAAYAPQPLARLTQQKSAPGSRAPRLSPPRKTSARARAKPERVRARHDALQSALSRGLENLPLDARQRARARALARDALVRDESGVIARSGASRAKAEPPTGLEAVDVETLSFASAIAYAIVFVDHVPLTQAEVAAPFRVSVARLRGRFAELRARLDILPGDSRYATPRAR